MVQILHNKHFLWSTIILPWSLHVCEDNANNQKCSLQKFQCRCIKTAASLSQTRDGNHVSSISFRSCFAALLQLMSLCLDRTRWKLARFIAMVVLDRVIQHRFSETPRKKNNVVTYVVDFWEKKTTARKEIREKNTQTLLFYSLRYLCMKVTTSLLCLINYFLFCELWFTASVPIWVRSCLFLVFLLYVAFFPKTSWNKLS